MRGASTKLAAAALAATTVAAYNTTRSNRRGVDGLPGGCITKNGVSFGVVPSDGPYDNVISSTYTMSDIDSKLGAKACAYGRYTQVSDSSYSNSGQLTGVLNEAVSSGAVFQASVMPTLNPITDFTSDTASTVSSILQQFTDQGVEVWLRFGHEMNWYSQQAAGPEYHISQPSDFVNVWKIMYDAVSDNSMIKMWWSPNQDFSSDYDDFWPGGDYVDMVGIDCYPSGDITDSTFSNCYQSFYNQYASESTPFAIGETGYCQGNSGNSANDAWLSQLMGQDQSDWPNYIAMSWYEFEQTDSSGTCDFRIIENGNLAETQSILLDGGSDGGSGGSGSGGSGGGSGGSGSNWPADACTWGCEGWSCSSSSPCQSAYTCTNGVCGDCSWGCDGWDCSSSQPCNADYSCVSGYCHHSGPATGSGGSSSSGDGSGSSGGSSGSNYPADACTWGCEGWDCSSSSPCQSAYTCSNGVCGDCSWGCNGWDCSANSPCNADYTCVSGYCHHSGPAT